MAGFQKLLDLTPDGQCILTAMYELHPYAKIRSVSNNDTAFNNRGPHHNVIMLSTWKGDTPEDLNATRKKVSIVTDLITSFENDPTKAKTKIYGNYGIRSNLKTYFEKTDSD